MPLVLDLSITHERWGSSSNFFPNGHLHYPRPDDIDRPQHEAGGEKIRDYRADYNNRPSHSIPFMPVVANTSPLTASTVRLCAFYICRLIGKPTAVLLLQELSLCKQTCSISSMTLQYLHVHTLTPHTLKPVLVSHNTDTPIYVLPLDLVLSVITNKSD